MLLQFDLKHIHKVNFYPSDNNFTQALLVLLVTNKISGGGKVVELRSTLFGADVVSLAFHQHTVSPAPVPS